ncbi:MAG: hypothetical protein Q8S32_01845 [Burkholderiaceae bacterium]|nr:hypothetical protein [Burkholderiaceae bacterium]
MTEIDVKIIGSGTVAQKPARIGPAIQLHAIPNSRAVFIRWEGVGSLSSSAFSVCNVNPRYVTNVVAVFSEDTSDENRSKESMSLLSLQSKKSEIHDDESRLWVDDPSIQVIKKFDPHGRFVINDDGTVFDQSTFLMWTYKIYPEKINFIDAVDIGKNYAGYSDWRIPKLSELKNIFPSGKEFFSSALTGYCWSTDQVAPGVYAALHKSGHLSSYDSLKRYQLLRLVRSVDVHPVQVTQVGTGSGSVKSCNVAIKQDGAFEKFPCPGFVYPFGAKIEFIAIPDERSYFVKWSGDVSGSDLACMLTIDENKSICAEFALISWPLMVKVKGAGEGIVTSTPDAIQYPCDTVVELEAKPAKGSFFKGWDGHLSGIIPKVKLKIDSPKTIWAEFVRVYPLTVSTQGKGLVKRSVVAEEYEAGSTVTLIATPEEGHEFVQWHGAATGTQPVCKLAMNEATAVKAEFRPLPTFTLKVTPTGTGRGVVWPTEQTFWKGSVVDMEAKAADGCVFDGWGGDTDDGLEPVRQVTVNSNLAITAAFNRVEKPHTDIALAFDEVSLLDPKNGEATVFYFTISNQSDRQISLEMPMAGFVTAQGEEIEQLGWAKGMMDGGKGATLRAGTFRKMGLVFDSNRIGYAALGEHLHITLLQNKPMQQLTFSYRCADEDDQVMALVHVSVEPLAGAETSHSAPEASANQAELATRMQLLEKSLQEALSRLNAPATPPPAAAPTQTLPEILAWLCTQISVPVAVLRQKLLPLGLMPSAVMDEVNERAFDVAGEPALEETANNVNVQRGVLLQVLAVW